jgi:hypothetical protein
MLPVLRYTPSLLLVPVPPVPLIVMLPVVPVMLPAVT